MRVPTVVIVVLVVAAVTVLPQCAPRPGNSEHPASTGVVQAKCTLRGCILLGGTPPTGWSCDILNEAWFSDPAQVGADGRFELRGLSPGEWSLNLWPDRKPAGGRVGITADLNLLPGENTWQFDATVGAVEIQNLQPLPTLEALSKLPKLDPKTGEETSRTLYELAWIRDETRGGAEKYAGRESVWTVDQVPAGQVEICLVTRYTSGREKERRLLLRFELKAGETKVVRLP